MYSKEFDKQLDEITAYLIGTKDKETVEGYKQTVLEVFKLYNKELLLNFIKWQNELYYENEKEIIKDINKFLNK